MRKSNPLESRPCACMVAEGVRPLAVLAGLPLPGRRKWAAAPPRVRRVNVPNLPARTSPRPSSGLAASVSTSNYADVRMRHYSARSGSRSTSPTGHCGGFLPFPAARILGRGVDLRRHGRECGQAPGPRSFRSSNNLENDACAGEPSRVQRRRRRLGQQAPWPFNCHDRVARRRPERRRLGHGVDGGDSRFPLPAWGLSEPPAPGTVWGLAVCRPRPRRCRGSRGPRNRSGRKRCSHPAPPRGDSCTSVCQPNRAVSEAVTGSAVVHHTASAARSGADAAVGGHTVCGEAD